MPTWKRTGSQGTDFDKSIQVILMNYVSQNWALTTPLTAVQMRFSTGWYDEQSDFQMMFRHDQAPLERPHNIGQDYVHRYDDFVNIHFFARQLTFDTETGNVEPPELDQMYRETMRLIGSNPGVLQASQDINRIAFIRPPFTLPRESDRESLFHGTGTVTVLYHRVFA